MGEKNDYSDVNVILKREDFNQLYSDIENQAKGDLSFVFYGEVAERLERCEFYTDIYFSRIEDAIKEDENGNVQIGNMRYYFDPQAQTLINVAIYEIAKKEIHKRVAAVVNHCKTHGVDETEEFDNRAYFRRECYRELRAIYNRNVPRYRQNRQNGTLTCNTLDEYIDLVVRVGILNACLLGLSDKNVYQDLQSMAKQNKTL